MSRRPSRPAVHVGAVTVLTALGGLMAAVPAAASVTYSATTSVRTLVYDGIDSFETIDVSPLQSGPAGVQASSVVTLAVNDSQGRPLTGFGRVDASAGPAGLVLSDSTSQDTAGTPATTYAFTETTASVGLSWASFVLGTPGALGSVTVEGWWSSSISPAPTGPGTLPSTATQTLGALVESRPAGSFCGTAACQERTGVSATLVDGGSYRPSAAPFTLPVTIQAGEWLTVDAWMSITSRSGYAGEQSMTAPPGSAHPDSFLVMRFSEGFAPADLTGLVDLGGGAYALAPAVPEPATWALWACGLAGMGLHRRRRATRARPSASTGEAAC